MQLFDLTTSEVSAQGLVDSIKDYCDKITVAGSIRRMKPMVHDIDVVCVPKMFQWINIKNKLDYIAEIEKSGNKIITGKFWGIPFDIYFATSETYETLMLIRTGSKEYNIKLCMKAKEKGMQLKANGEGLLKGNDIISNTEHGIIKELLGEYVEPKDR